MFLELKKILFACLFIATFANSNDLNQTSIGILATRPPEEMLKAWQPLADSLSKSIPTNHFVILPLSYKELNEKMQNNELDFIFVNPECYIAFEIKYGASRIATVVRKVNGEQLHSFGGTIVTRADRNDINTLADIKYKKIAAVSKESLGGYLAQVGTLYDNGIDLTNSKNITFTDMPHDKAIFAVKNLEADVAFVRSSVLESMAQSKLIKLEDFKIINKQNFKDYPYAVSTQLYPEWPFAAAKNTDQELVRKVTIALLSIPFGSDVTKAAGYYGWYTPSAYESIQLLMQKLRSYPFDTPRQMSIAEILKQYQLEISILLIGIITILAALTFRAYKLSGRLKTQMVVLKEEIDIRKQAEEKLKLAASVYENAAEGIVITLQDQTIIEVNDSFTELTGYSKDEAIGKTPRILKSGLHPKEFYEQMFNELKEKGYWQGEVWNRNKKGELYAELINISTIKDDNNNIEKYIGIFSDITSIKQHQEQLAYLVNYDPLTKLANRRLLYERLEHAVRIAKRLNDNIAIFFIDLDNFKYINDTLGHEAGDMLLIQVSERIKKSVRESDTLARMGGDEFVLTVEHITNYDDIALIANGIIQTLSSSFEIAGNQVFSSASIGISIFPADGTDIDTLMKKADIAMYNSKDLGKGRFSFFSEELENRLKNKLEIENDLRRAVENKEFVLYYQPQVDARNDSIMGIEALIRWNHPSKGLLLPAEFLPIAEESNLIVEIGDLVINGACGALKSWINAGAHPVNVSINIADKQFNKHSFVQKIRQALEMFNIPPHLITIELTEGVIMNKPDEAVSKIKELKQLGVKISIDDFGTGYSSLSHLKKFPIDQFKIDRSFIKDINECLQDKEITIAMIALGKALNIEIITEGVEENKQLDFLKENGCFYIQGFLYSKAISKDEIADILLHGAHLRQIQTN